MSWSNVTVRGRYRHGSRATQACLETKRGARGERAPARLEVVFPSPADREPIRLTPLSGISVARRPWAHSSHPWKAPMRSSCLLSGSRATTRSVCSRVCYQIRARLHSAGVLSQRFCSHAVKDCGMGDRGCGAPAIARDRPGTSLTPSQHVAWRLGATDATAAHGGGRTPRSGLAAWDRMAQSQGFDTRTLMNSTTSSPAYWTARCSLARAA